MPRLAAGVLVSALIRRVSDGGGHAMVLARGDRDAGAILLVCVDRGRLVTMLERTLDPGGVYRWTAVGPGDSAAPDESAAYVDRRRRNDPDLWVVELDIPDAERLAAEMIG